MSNSPTKLIKIVADLLCNVGDTYFGQNESAYHDRPRRFVWVPIDSTMGGPKRTSTATNHSLDSVDLRFAVECWGHNFDDAFYLANALLTAMQLGWGGRNYRCDTIQPWEHKSQEKGFVLAVQVEISIHLNAIDLSQPPPDIPEQDNAMAQSNLPIYPDPVYGPQDKAMAPINAVETANSTSIPGDGWLESNEENSP